ncbi:MAG: LPS export ABC transporter permease LptF [Thermodesulfovibrionales bacterium]
MLIIHRRTLKELFVTFVLTLAFLNSILMMEKILRLSRLLAGVGSSMADMGRIILYIQPPLLLLSIPMAFLLATLLVYGRMNLDNEITIMRTAGMAFRRITVPVTILGLVCFAASLGVSFWLGPKASVRLRQTITQIIAVRSTLAIEEGTFNTAFKGITIMIKGKRQDDTLENIFIHDNRKKDEPKVLMAKEGKFFMQEGLSLGLLLTNGYVNLTKGAATTELFFDRYSMALSLEADSPAPKKIEFTPAELLQKIREEDSKKKRLGLLLELHRRLSLPVVCLLLVLLGPPLSLIAGKTGRLGGLALGLLVFTLYYMALIYGENLVMAGKTPHAAGAWAASVILAGFSVFLFLKESRT